MRDDPYSHDPMHVQHIEDVPTLEDLPPKQVPQTPTLHDGAVVPYRETVNHEPVHHEAIHHETLIEIEEARQEDARVVKFTIGKLNDFLQWFAVVLEVTLLVRFVLKLIGADPTNVFAGFLYALTNIILYPFLTIVHNPSIGKTQVFELSTLIGMAIYWLIFWAVRRFLRILISEPEEPVT